MTERERDVIMPRMIQGFKDLAQHAGTSINGGQTVFNPWLIIGKLIIHFLDKRYSSSFKLIRYVVIK